MNCLDFCNSYFDEDVETVQGIFKRKITISEIPISRTFWKDALELELDKHWRKLKGIKEILLTRFKSVSRQLIRITHR